METMQDPRSYLLSTRQILRVDPTKFYVGGTQCQLVCLIEPDWKRARYRPIPVTNINRLIMRNINTGRHIYDVEPAA
jgi:hypothetical protein